MAFLYLHTSDVHQHMFNQSQVVMWILLSSNS